MRLFSEPANLRWRRALALVAVLGALAFLLVATSTTTQAFVTKVGHDTLDDFAAGEFHRTGLLDIPGEGIDSIQLLPVGLFGTWKTDDQHLPVALTELCGVATGGHLIVAGGFDSSFQFHDKVYVAAIGSGGDLEPWVEQTTHPLPQALSAAAATVYPAGPDSSYIYVLGGIATGDSFDTVYYTTFHHDTGAIDDWATTEPLSIPVHYLGAVAHNGFLYAVGGYSVVSPFLPYTLDNVFFAKIQPDGSLGPWKETAPLPEPLSSHLVIAYQEGVTNTLYVVGGGERPGLPFNASFHVYFADIDADGGLGPWQLSEGNMPSKIYAHSGALVADQIFVTGGRDANNTISDTVKAAIVDTGNPDFRLYDWCLGVPPPACTYGAWQSGPLLLYPRAFHVTLHDLIYVYTLGGVGGNGQPTDTVFRGSLTEPGAAYSPWGNYISPYLDFEVPVDLRKIEWDATLAYPLEQSLDLSYRYKKQGGDWQPWSAAQGSSEGTNEINFGSPITDVRRFQYRINMTTNLSTSSPLLNWVDVYYELDDPEVEVRKDSGSVISVTVNDLIEYTIHYTNNGEWVAENTVISETLPEHTTYSGGPEWQQVGASDVYTYKVGNLGAKAIGQIPFDVQVNGDVPVETLFITNKVEIDYPAMTDAFAQVITDPVPANNRFELGNPFLPYVITITKEASPTHGSFVPQLGRITYTLTFSNKLRAEEAENAYVLDPLPEHTRYVSGSIFGPGADDSDPNQLRWDLLTVKAGVSGTLGYVVTVPLTTTPGLVLSNDAALYSSNGPPKDSLEVTHTVVALTYEVLAQKYADPPPGSEVEPGDRITYTIRYTNGGWVPASVAMLTDTFDQRESYTIVSTDPPPDFGSEDVWTLGPLGPGRKGSIEVVVELTDTLPSNWEVTNQVSIDSPEGDPFHSDVVTHVVTNTATPLVDLVIGEISISPPNPQPGEAVEFRATITNVGTLDAAAYFWTSLYAKPAPSEPPDGPSDHDNGYCLNNCSILRSKHLRYVDSLNRGEHKDLVFTLGSSEPYPVFPTADDYDVYIQIDVAFDDPYYNHYWGVYPELDEGNNIAHKFVIVGGGTTFYLPLIYKNY